MSDIGPKYENMFDAAMERMLRDRKNGKRAEIKKANQKALEAFESRPTLDVTQEREWYSKQYAANGLAYPFAKGADEFHINQEFQARLKKIAERHLTSTPAREIDVNIIAQLLADNALPAFKEKAK